jgi:hypothetical protein
VAVRVVSTATFAAAIVRVAAAAVRAAVRDDLTIAIATL